MPSQSTLSVEQTVHQLLSGTGDLPVLPQAAARLLQEFDDDRLTTLRLAEIVKKDPVLASAVLRVANSALYGGQREITDLAFAMTRIGLNQVRNLILALVLRSRMADPQVYGSLGASIMDHSLAVAFASRLVADAVDGDGEETFLCGLLHDFGRLALIKALRESSGITNSDLPGEMNEIVSRHHAEAGALLASRWGLPEVVSCVARHHHDPESAGEHRLMAAAVCLGDCIAHALGLGTKENSTVDLFTHPARAIVRLEDATVEEILTHLPGLFQVAKGALGS